MDHGPIKRIWRILFQEEVLLLRHYTGYNTYLLHNIDLCTKVWALYGRFCQVHTLGLPLRGSLPGHAFYMAESAIQDPLFSVRGRGFVVVLQNWPLRQIGLENGLKSHASIGLNVGLAHLKTRGGLGGLGQVDQT